MADENLERVTMLWPKELKQQVRELSGKRGITEFVLKAVNVHLGADQDIAGLESEIGEIKHFAQLLADQLVLGGDREERMQFLMELQFPSWLQTQGWPSAYAERVRPEEAPEPVPAEPPTTFAPVIMPVAEPVEIPAPVVVPEPEPQPEPVATVVEVPMPAATDRSDLFSRVMAKTGGALADVPGLKVASEVQPPAEPFVQRDVCGSCGAEKVDGECWTCAF